MDLTTRLLNLINFSFTLALNEILREAQNTGKDPVTLLNETIGQIATNDTLAASLLEKYRLEIAKEPIQPFKV